MTLSQDLSGLLKGLGANFRLAYDNYSSIWEDHSQSYIYSGYTPTWNESGTPTYTVTSGGEPSVMGKDGEINDWTRQFNFAGSIDYSRSYGIMSIVILMAILRG